MSKKKPKQNVQSSGLFKGNKKRRNLFFISLTFFIFKIILILSIQNGGWLGADGENYLNAMQGLIKDGIFSSNDLLSYWPAGYSIILWILSNLSTLHLIEVISIFQTCIYFIACAYFAEKLRQTPIFRLAVPTAFILALNPTLTLSSFAVGYESPVAALLILSIGLIIHTQLNPSNKTLWKTLPLVAGLQGLSAFFQPRCLLISFFIFLIWGLKLSSRKQAALLVITGMAMVMILPAGEIVRNVKAKGVFAISTNLGVTMRIGAGDSATGGYGKNPEGLTCDPTPPATKVTDSQLVGCVINWYAHHPVKTLQLVFNKSEFFWSPWSGPLGNGTMARNPWMKIDPIHNIAESPTGAKLVYGWIGKTISWLWLLGGLALMFIGFGWIWRKGELERLIAMLALTPIILAWITSIATIGDHRFRVPTMGVSLFLQVAGAVALKIKFMKTAGLSALEPKASAR